jgi:hypothetical protein
LSKCECLKTKEKKLKQGLFCRFNWSMSAGQFGRSPLLKNHTYIFSIDMPEEHPSRVAFSQYPLPSTTLKACAPNVHQLASIHNSNALPNTIPSAKELQNIKLELERLHPTSETRIKHLRADLHNIEKVVKAKKTGNQAKDKYTADRNARSKEREIDRDRRDRERDREQDRDARREASHERENEKDKKKYNQAQSRSSSLAREKSIDHREQSASADEGKLYTGSCFIGIQDLCFYKGESDETQVKQKVASSEDEVSIKKENSGKDKG